LDGKKWIFYSRFRASSWFKKTKKGWKIIHQHSSFPDTRASEGENIATEKISRENQQLREAVKRRTKELEDKNRELEIEAALERVRARALSMHHSEELSQLVSILFDELIKLDLVLARCIIWILNKEDSSARVWIANSEDRKTPESFHVPPLKHPYYESIIKAWKKKNPKWIYNLAGAEKRSIDRLLLTQTELSRLPKVVKKGIEEKKQVFISGSFQKFGFIEASGPLRHTEEQMEILSRFTRVFDQAYTRFLDLQKAEAQAREAQIEAALEKIRSRSLAMHKSDELRDVVAVMFDKMTDLGLRFDGALICLFDEKERDLQHWIATRMQSGPVHIILPFEERMKGNQVVRDTWRAKKKGEDIFNRVYTGKEKNEYFKYVARHNFSKIPVEVQQLHQKTNWTISYAAASNCLVGLDSWSGHTTSDSDFQTLKRFARVFEQAYTRFLDLQKAEAHAREAEIQLALERVRARTMAMQNSGAFPEVAALLFDQVKALGIDTYACGFNLWDAEHKNLVSWMSNPRGTLNPPFEMPIHTYDQHERVYLSWKNGDSFLEDDLRGRALAQHYKFLRSFPLLDEAFSKSEKAGIKTPDRQVHNNAHFSNGYLLFITSAPCPQYHEIFKRFAKVFNQTYTRFLDLQKAEAQAREAQIEVALERVRARALAMRQSEELLDVAKVLREQMGLLGQPELETSAVHLYEEDPHHILSWRAFRLGSDLKSKISYGSMAIPKDSCEIVKEFTRKFYSKENAYTIEISGVRQRAWYKVLFKIAPDVAHAMKRSKSTLEKRYYHFSKFSGGALLMVSSRKPSQETTELQKRSADVFDLAYRRFKDLKNAEAQTREAQIETALERVRSRSMAMHHTSELQEVINTVHQQFRLLNMSATGGTFIGINAENTHELTIWGAGGVTDYAERVRFPFLNRPIYTGVIEGIRRGPGFFTEAFSHKEKIEFFHHLFKYPPFNTAPAKRKKELLSRPGGYTRSCFVSKYTTVLVINHHGQKFSEDENRILIRFGKVFDQTYTRFLDLQKAEAQAREAQIEAALERVRARTMAMHQSTELPETAAILFNEFEKLGAGTLLQATIGVYHPDNRLIEFHATNPEGGGVRVEKAVMMSMDEPILLKPIIRAWEQHKKSVIVELTGKKLEKWLRYRNAHMGGNVHSADTGGRRVITAAFFSKGHLTLSSAEPRPDEIVRLLERFAAVFDGTYTRFLDLQKAEVQAREAQIEAALERVRARTMAMHKSDELREAGELLWNELTRLGISSISSGYVLIDEGKEIGWTYAPNPSTGNKIGEPLGILHSETKEMRAVLAAWKKQQPFSVIEMDEQDTITHQTFIAERSLSPDGNIAKWITASQLIALSPKRLFLHNFNFKQGYLLIVGGEKLNEAQIELMLRFTGVFQQTYTRFLDLQKAEAQAREAQIETALERVRSRSMAMHNSEELAYVISIVSEQLQNLQVRFEHVSFVINSDAEDYHFWTALYGKSRPYELKVPYLDHPLVNSAREARARGLTFFSDTLTPDQNRQWLEHAFAHNPDHYLSSEEKSYALSRGFARSVAIMPSIMLVVGNYASKPYSEADNEIIRRFAAVFEQSYTRFLDLQKAEAQAREAQIEASLERVRSKTMAMHNSQDVGETVVNMFNEFVNLGIHTNRCGILIFNDEHVVEVWTARYMQGGPAKLIIGQLELSTHRMLRLVYDAWKEKETFYQYDLLGDDLVAYYTAINNSKFYPTQFNLSALPREEFHSDFFFADGAVFSFSGKPLIDEHARIMKRFAGVFGQTYRRYLDLKRAEAQAREAQIEAALERVRAKAMAMHSSRNLNETIQAFYAELVSMSLTPRRCGIALIDKESRIAELSGINTTGEGQSVEVIGKIKLTGHPVLQGIYDHWLQKKEYYPVLRGNEANEYFQLFRKQVSIPNYPNDAVQYGYFFVFEEGGIYAWSENELHEDELKIYRRFSTVFSLTYKRYNELRGAEARALEAVKQAALDRVRAEIASMRTVQDLDRITPLIWRELTTLSIPFVRCGVFIIDDHEKLVHTFLSTPDGKAIAAFHLPFEMANNLAGAIDGWRRHQRYVTHWVVKDFELQADVLVKQGSIANREQYLHSIPKAGIYLHFLPFLQGMLYVGHTDALGDDDLDLVQSVADAFSTAYARYEDFNKLEAAKREVEKTLTDLKQAQQQLVQSEKMASLGELTAGIAHEIQNPLNFVNNFSEVSNELVREIQEIRCKAQDGKADNEEAHLLNDIASNLEKINFHGKRADAIVKSMLQHSRTGSDKKESTDINALCDEYLRLAFHGLRAKDKSFNAKFETSLDPTLPKVQVMPQEIGRVILNLINNAFYAVNERAKSESQSPGFQPEVNVSTKNLGNKIQIMIQDNGTGIPEKVKDKIFQPFFTTKPTGQGTGLGLSLAYDIVTKGHGGELKVETKEGKGTEFVIRIPLV
ncbi:MAG: nuclear transport factor 2 family protein, partial [Bacteroidetes bacterium]|nr:nuclear transport factor 2 family protein [Bacteroidota bacterium]